MLLHELAGVRIKNIFSQSRALEEWSSWFQKYFESFEQKEKKCQNKSPSLNARLFSARQLYHDPKGGRTMSLPVKTYKKKKQKHLTECQALTKVNDKG